jgi:SulP family sulfate permease
MTTTRPDWLLHLFPFVRWWHRVDRSTLKADLIAGVIGAVLVLPQGVAFASLSECRQSTAFTRRCCRR